MKLALLFLCLLLLVIAAHATPRASDIIDQVPITEPAYQQLRLLYDHHLLPDARRDLFATRTPSVLTRYDFAFLMMEPLERCIALVNTQSALTISPEGRRRSDLALMTIQPLTATELDGVLQAAEGLTRTFRHDLDELSPGLSTRALAALHSLTLPQYRPWIKSGAATPSLSIPLPLMPDPLLTGAWLVNPAQNPPISMNSGASPLLRSLMPPDSRPIPMKPGTPLEAAIDLAFGRVNLYGSVAPLSGEDPSQLFRPEGTGKMMVGLRLDLGSLNDLGFCGIFEYHVLRTGDPTNPEMNTGAVGGIGVKW